MEDRRSLHFEEHSSIFLFHSLEGWFKLVSLIENQTHNGGPRGMGDGETALKQTGSTFLRPCPVSICPHTQAKGPQPKCILIEEHLLIANSSVLSCWFCLVSRRVGGWLWSPLSFDGSLR